MCRSRAIPWLITVSNRDESGADLVCTKATEFQTALRVGYYATKLWRYITALPPIE